MLTLKGFKWLPEVQKPACYPSIGTDAFQMKEGYIKIQRKLERKMKCVKYVQVK
ncbi:unnamed protein product [Brugia pahangi]|uniref:Myosin motor domain-containing protein n=1 Tax=Brugia pahangi TaxID=6280 RepID=A0A0N4T9H1_BRUPA|nr:unnamed protein product [Brugia pahangi]